ncbi:MAG: beta-galactosidase [Planctomycetota bacterium]|jgi:hypothetical protein
MPTVTYNDQAFAIDGRRVWLLGAGVQYCRVPPELWADRLRAVAQAGFNLVDACCPWSLHEPRKGRYCFEHQADVRAFVEQCRDAGLWVMLRLGPFVGHGLDAGGLPPWLIEQPGLRPREASEPFLERVTRYMRKLWSSLDDLQVSKGGPILLVQGEHAWTCGNDEQGERYLREITRIIRESGVSVPIINSNDLWTERAETIDTWRGSRDLLVHLRQLRALRPETPRIVSTLEVAPTDTWGGPAPAADTARTAIRHLAEVLAAGAQPVVSPFHGGTNFGFLGGRVAGCPDGFVATCPASAAPLAEAGDRGPAYHALRRLATFANHFSHVFSDLDPAFQPVVLALDELVSGRNRRRVEGVSVVSQRGNNGRVAFVFGDAKHTDTTLLLENGIQLDVPLGEHQLGWYVFGVDVHGAGRLDYANLSPFAVVDRSILVLFGPAKSTAFLSVDGTPFEATVPGGATPVVLEQRGLTIVICNEKQIDATYHDDEAVYVGVEGLDEEGRPIPAGASYWAVTRGGRIERRDAGDAAGRRRGGRAPALGEWTASPTEGHVAGSSARYAGLDGPTTLAGCGATTGYGWYRVRLSSKTARKRLVHLPGAGDRLALFLDGEPMRLFGLGPGADAGPFELKLPRGEVVLTALVDNLGRFAEGNEPVDRKGWWEHLHEIKPLRSIRPRIVEADAVDPFALRGFIAERARGLSDTRQLEWTVSHLRKTPLLLTIDDASPRGTIVLNGEPIAYHGGDTSSGMLRLMLDPATLEPFKRGRNVLRFAPDPGTADALATVRAAATLHECTEALSAKAAWAFAKWEPPAASSYRAVAKTAARSLRGRPCWWRCSFTAPAEARPLRLDVAGLSKGQAFLNGHNAGRYFTATGQGRAVGPQNSLYLPPTWLRPDEPNELIVFDEHGFEPARVRLRPA